MTAAHGPHPLQCIVVGTDFSEPAEHAVKAAADLARVHGAALFIVHAVDPMIGSLEVSPQIILDDVRAGLKNSAESVRDSGVQVDTQMRIGKSWWAINEAATESHADLVVVASVGRSALARAVLGSTADRVLRTSDKPVLLMPAASRTSTVLGIPSRWKTALAAIDFSEESHGAAALAARLLENNGTSDSQLTLFHTVAMNFDFAAGGSRMPDAAHWDQLEAEARTRLEKLADGFLPSRLAIRAVTHRGAATDGILQEAERSNVDFIALGTHGRGAFGRAMLGSVAERVIHHARCSVLTVRHPGAVRS